MCRVSVLKCGGTVTVTSWTTIQPPLPPPVFCFLLGSSCRPHTRCSPSLITLQVSSDIDPAAQRAVRTGRTGLSNIIYVLFLTPPRGCGFTRWRREQTRRHSGNTVCVTAHKKQENVHIAFSLIWHFNIKAERVSLCVPVRRRGSDFRFLQLF